MNISVVIATHNRANLLTGAIESVLDQTVARAEYELIVVDSASTDHTQSVVNRFRSLGVRYLRAPEPGLSRARNLGWNAARAPYVAFLDDDAAASPVWLEKLLEVFTLHPHDLIAVGGKVELAFPHPPPPWLGEALLFTLGNLDCGTTLRSLNDTPHFLHGCNMAFAKRTLEQCGGFNETLGRKGKSLISAAEILLQKNILSHNGAIYYHPAAAVRHVVSTQRLSRRWFLKRMYWEGYSLARIQELEHAKAGETKRRALIFKELHILVRSMNRWDAILRLSDPIYFSRLAQKMVPLGAIAEYLRLH